MQSEDNASPHRLVSRLVDTTDHNLQFNSCVLFKPTMVTGSPTKQSCAQAEPVSEGRASSRAAPSSTSADREGDTCEKKQASHLEQLHLVWNLQATIPCVPEPARGHKAPLMDDMLATLPSTTETRPPYCKRNSIIAELITPAPVNVPSLACACFELPRHDQLASAQQTLGQ